ncbi:hypothetical protein E4U56_007226 [Claviceps arundinis]|uniref:Uncharacterized protein n=1 Tax=Claviceps arundinis TaxID=1623583 RepID=A0A9P7MW92_9HYPO|nr:hypothetical protein E4U56_007226 [Claviceps arundinis]
MVDSVPVTFVPSIQEAQVAGQKMNSYPPKTSLTPVQVSGKRQRSSPDLAAHDLPKRKKTIQTLPSVPVRCSSRSQPSLPTLPVELLEIIFLCSMNLALPRASPLLGAKLSAKSTRLRAFMMGFHDTWDQCFGIPEFEIFDSVMDIGMELKGDEKLQTALLSMPWVDIDFILEAQQTWADKYAVGRCYRHQEDKCCRPHPPWIQISHAGHPYHEHGLQHAEEAWKFNARACFEADYERARQYPPMPDSFWERTLVEVNPNASLPVELITGPWDEEKKRRLYWLSRGGKCYGGMDYNFSELPWKVRLACLDAVVISAEKLDPLIFNCLIGEWLFEDVPRDAKRKPLVNLCKRIAEAGDTPEMMDTLRYIVRLMDTDWDFMEYHMSEDEWNAKIISFDDEESYDEESDDEESDDEESIPSDHEE